MQILDKIKRTLLCQWRHLIWNVSKKINRDWFDHVRFKQTTGRKLNYKNPIYLNDKLMWLNRYWNSPLKVQCADKIRVHDYIKQKGLEKYVVPILGVWSNADEIDFDKLPMQFVLKCNHGCGYNIIVTNKQNLDIKKTIEKLNKWLKEDYGKLHNEYHYSKIEPKILAEKYLIDLLE